MCEIYYIAFIEFMITEKTLDYTNLFSPNDYQKNDRIIYISALKTNMVKENLSFDFRKKNLMKQEIMF